MHCFCQCFELRHSIGFQYTCASDNQRFLCRFNHGYCFFNLPLMTFVGWIVAFQGDGRIKQLVKLAHRKRLALYIFRNIYQYGTWTTRTSNIISLFQYMWQVTNILYKIVVFCNRHSNTRNVCFLE